MPVSKKINNEGLLKEYDSLRAEIMLFINRGPQNLNFAITITLGVMAFGYSQKNEFLFFVAGVIIYLLWVEEWRRFKSINRAAAYIEVFIEPEIPNMGWEALISKTSMHENKDHKINRIISQTKYPYMIVMNIVSGLFVFSFKDYDFYTIVFVDTLIAAFTVFLIYLGYKTTYKTSIVGRKKEVKLLLEIKDIENKKT